MRAGQRCRKESVNGPAFTGFTRRIKDDIIICAKMEPSKLLEGPPHQAIREYGSEERLDSNYSIKPFVCNTNGDEMGRN
jgi:hypothetical protein